MGTSGVVTFPKCRVVVALFRNPDLPESELVATGGFDHASQGLREQLGSKANAYDRTAALCGASKVIHFLVKG